MKKFKNILTIGLMIFTLLLTSCSKDGAIGPQGIQGAAGAAGTNGSNGSNGADGADGTNGMDGNANVIYSEWFQPTAWIGSGTAFAYFDHTAIDLTQEVIDQGVLLAYAKFIIDGNNVRPLPASYSNGVLWNYHITAVEIIRFTGARTDQTTNVDPLTGDEFRYIIIPGSVLASKGLTKNSLKKMSYVAVMDHFGLEY